MTFILILTTCITAFVWGLTMGPAALVAFERFKVWDKKCTERAAARGKRYSIPGVWFTHPDIWDNRGHILGGIGVFIVLVWFLVK